MNDFEIFTVSSLEKVFPGIRPSLYEEDNTCFQNETFSFQVAYRHEKKEVFLQYCTWEVKGDLRDFITVRPVAPALCTTPRGSKNDDYYLVRNASLVPDILRADPFIYVRYREWGALWITVRGELPVGDHEIGIEVKNSEGKALGKTRYRLSVLKGRLPEASLDFAHWLHYDSLAAYYGVEVFGERFDDILSRYIENMVKHGVNTLLVPLFTPPINTAVGGERLTVQLVDVTVNGDSYVFDFGRLERFLRKAENLGIKKFEMSHLYTQWGAEAAPRIMAIVDGKYCRIFGWEDDSLGEKYVRFVRLFLTALTDFLDKKGYDESRCFFHISDEPNRNHIGRYGQIRKIVKPILGKYKIFDALSDYEYYSQGIVDNAIVVTESAEPFLKNQVKDLWVYYCCGQGADWLSNRFLSMPLQRTRILGIQLYMTGCKGFLHWGYNYYNSALSERYIDPYEVTDADGSFQSGDSFIVYPAKDGKPLDSVRHEALFDAFQDFRALSLLEEKIGREKTLRFLKENGVKENFTDYPKSALWHSGLRKKINRLIVS